MPLPSKFEGKVDLFPRSRYENRLKNAPALYLHHIYRRKMLKNFYFTQIPRWMPTERGEVSLFSPLHFRPLTFNYNRNEFGQSFPLRARPHIFAAPEYRLLILMLESGLRRGSVSFALRFALSRGRLRPRGRRRRGQRRKKTSRIKLI